MANHKSAEKRQRQNQKRRIRNRSSRSALRTAVKKVVKASEAGDGAAARSALQAAAPLIQRMAARGLIHKRTASRCISRLTVRANATKTIA